MLRYLPNSLTFLRLLLALPMRWLILREQYGWALAMGVLVGLSVAVITRDLVIMVGAGCYYRFIGPFEFVASNLGKSNIFIQISYCVMVLVSQVVTNIPPGLLLFCSEAVLFPAAASGFDYVMSWTIKALESRKTKE